MTASGTADRVSSLSLVAQSHAARDSAVARSDNMQSVREMQSESVKQISGCSA